MMIFKAIIVVIFFGFSISHAEYHVSPILKANWQLKKQASFCQLTQQIPLYGTVKFAQQSGELLRFSLQEERFKPTIVKASLSIDNAPWIHESTPMQDHLVHLDKTSDIQNFPRLSVYGNTAEIMLDALSKGKYPTFSYVRSAINGTFEETNVAVSAIKFSEKYQQFVDCRKNFLPYGTKDRLEKNLYFIARSTLFNADVLKRLQDTARYIKEVKGTRIIIASNTASAGNRDKKWFAKRAKAVTAKLNQMGVPQNKITTRTGIVNPSNNKTVKLSLFGPDAINTIFYRKGRTQLSPNEKKRLDLLFQYATSFQANSQIIISSHTDSKGKRATNLKVSKNRGNEIMRYLVSKGIDEKRIVVKAYGESKPIKSNRFPRGRAQNRRATVRFLS